MPLGSSTHDASDDPADRVLDALPVFAVRCGPGGHVRHANAAALRMGGLTHDDVAGRSLADAPWWSGDPDGAARLRDALQTEAGADSQDGRPPIAVTLHGPDTTHPLHLSVRAVSADGTAAGSVIVTGLPPGGSPGPHRERRKPSLLQSLALESAQMGTWGVDPVRQTVRFDARSAELFGLAPSRDHPLDDGFARVHPDDSPAVRAALNAALDPQQRAEYDVVYRIVDVDSKGEPPRFRSVRALGRADFGPPDAHGVKAVTRFVGVLLDDTEKHAHEDALRAAKRAAESANDAKTEFLQNMSHEIRTPMAAILGYADILARHQDDADNLELVETIRRNGRHLLDIINDILDLAKIESGVSEINCRPFPPEDVVEEVVSMMGVRAAEKGITLRAVFTGMIPETLDSDPVRLRQILINLVGNAIKFTDEGAVTITVDADADPTLLGFAVTDSGVGISPDDQKRIFAPFTQAETAHDRSHGGTGLGLTISRRLTDLLGGELAVSSSPGQGSRFCVSLPIRNPDAIGRRKVTLHAARDEAGGPSSPQVEEHVLESRRILVVDDRREMRNLVQYLLEEHGATVVTAGNGQKALDAYGTHYAAGDGTAGNTGFDAVIMDMQMPVMDGYAATRALRERGIDVPIIAVTANALQGEHPLCLAAGCSAYVTKPLDGGALVRLILDELADACGGA